jgi:PKD repeat protein
MRKKSVFIPITILAAFLAVVFTSCENEEPIPVPTVKILADIDPNDQYTVMITVQATDAESYTWNYGDGESATTSGNHTYTYAASGDYTISVTVTNESGTASASADITINPSIQEMLAGVDAGGKEWVVSATASSDDGVGPLAEKELTVNLPVALVGGDLLGYVNLPDEYDNVFTFKPDGSYTVDNVNGQNLCTALKAIMTTGEQEPGNTWTYGGLGFATMPYTVDANAKWNVTEDATIAFAAMSEDPTSGEANPPLTPMDVSYEGVTQLSISENGYFGILDLTNYVIIRSISPNKMQVDIIAHTTVEQPSIFVRVTMEPK